MRSSVLSAAAAFLLARGFPDLTGFHDSGPLYLPPHKKKTGALKIRRAAKKRKRKARRRP